MSSKSKQGNLIGAGPARDGAFGGKDRIRLGWKPGDSIGCNYGPNNPGKRRDKVNFGRRLAAKASQLPSI